MPSDTLEEIQAALGHAFVLQRELGGGGMSRVFLAHDPTLDRPVVVKLLHPSLANGVNVDRFKREIQLAAQLQHPHVVPLLTAGELDGVPYLTMPFVDGRSLRARLDESPQLPIGEALDILRDVARALAFAHGRGVVHRDVKPDNVLLAEGSATVTDFGVAKAVTAARSTAMPTLTSIGTSIGTPAYMAPEQAAGDPETDHRADIYAWGVMAYEMIAGRRPFTAASPQKLLAAHMSETPEPLVVHRHDCPPSLDAFVQRCLAKDPADRPQSAVELSHRLAEVATPSGGATDAGPAISTASRRMLGKALALYTGAVVATAALAYGAMEALGLPDWVLPGALIVMALGLPVLLFTGFVTHETRLARVTPTITPGGSVAAGSTMTRIAVKASPYVTWRKAALGGVIAVTLFAGLVATFMVLRALGIGPAGSLLAKGVIGDQDRILVADFNAPASDSGLGAVVSEAVRMGLAESRALKVMQPTEVATALARMERPATTRIDQALAQEMAQREGAKVIVDGDVTPLGAGFIVTVRLRGTNPPDALASYRETAATATDLVPAIDRATRKLRGRIGESLKTVRASMPLERATTSSLIALRRYTEGYRKNAIERDFAAAIPILEEAVRLDSNFALAYRQLGLVYNNAGLRPQRRDSLFARAYELRDRLSDLERAMVEATYFSSGSRRDRPKAALAHERVLSIDPTTPSALNELGLIASSRRDYARAESLYRAGQNAHPEISYFWSNIIPALVSQRKFADAHQAAEEYQRRFPGTAGAALAGVAVWGTQGRLDSVTAICKRVATSNLVAQVRANALTCLGAVEMTRGRLRERDRITGELRSVQSGRGVVINAADTIAFDSAYAEIWFRERPAIGLRLLDSVTARRGPSLDVINLYALAGSAAKARALLARYDSSIAADTARVRLERDRRHRTLGEIALAERKYDVAVREFHAADTLYDGGPALCASCLLPRLAHAYDLAGNTDEAIRVFERYLASTYSLRGRDVDPYYLAGTYKRLGELYDQKGNREKAATYYTRFIDLWKDADPELQPKVAGVRQRLAALGPEVAGR